MILNTKTALRDLAILESFKCIEMRPLSVLFTIHYIILYGPVRNTSSRQTRTTVSVCPSVRQYVYFQFKSNVYIMSNLTLTRQDRYRLEAYKITLRKLHLEVCLSNCVVYCVYLKTSFVVSFKV